MQHLPFDKPGRFWRGNLHTHSTVSDGGKTPEETCAFYRTAGYDFLSITDHFMERYDYPIVDTRPYRTPDFTTIIGAELHTPATAAGDLWHILAVGLPQDFPSPVPGESAPDLAARALAAGAYVVAAHPAWYSLSEADILSLGNIHAIETYNGLADDFNDRADSWAITERLLTQGHRYFACAVDDSHFDPSFDDTLRGWVQVKSPNLEPDTLVQALKNGHYYSSTGPQIFDIQLEPGKEIYVSCSPASRIIVTGHTWRTAWEYGPGITEATLDLSRLHQETRYCRVTVLDGRGGTAWSNPIWFED